MIKDKLVIKLDQRFMKQVRGRIDGYEFDVGVIQNSVHKKAIPGSFKSIAGGPARRTGRASGSTVSDVSEYARKSGKVNFYTAPWNNPANGEILRFANQFLKALISSKSIMRNRRRIENLLQAVIRNPITRGDYGNNTPAQTRKKGFNRRFIDTGQLFNAIRARLRRR